MRQPLDPRPAINKDVCCLPKSGMQRGGPLAGSNPGGLLALQWQYTRPTTEQKLPIAKVVLHWPLALICSSRHVDCYPDSS